MAVTESYTLSESEARRIRRGAFLPILLIAPMAAMFGLDSSKSQPMHLLMTFAVASVIGAIIVSICWHGAQKRIADFSKTSLSIIDGKIVWTTGTRQTELDLQLVTDIDVRGTRKSIRTIILRRADGTSTALEGYERMNDLLGGLTQQTDAKETRTHQWLGF